MKPDEEELQLLEEVMRLREKLQNVRIQTRDFDAVKIADEVGLNTFQTLPLLTPIYQLRAHTAKVYDAVWSNDDKYILTIGAEGYVVIWEAKSGLIHNVIDASAIQPLTACTGQNEDIIFCGGLCANVAAYRRRHKTAEDGYSVYEHSLVYEHSGQVHSISSFGADKILTAAVNDGAILWDIETVKPAGRFAHPGSDVLATCLAAKDENVIFTGDSHGLVRMWDQRQTSRPAVQFEPHESDVTCVKPLPNGTNVVSGSEDTYIHLYDIRSDATLCRYSDPGDTVTQASMEGDYGQMVQTDEFKHPPPAALSDLSVSQSGRVVISGCKNSAVYYWDVAQPGSCIHRDIEIGPVMKVAMSNQKTALVMMTWDPKIRIRIMRPQ